jgi:hypothetical protein
LTWGRLLWPGSRCIVCLTLLIKPSVDIGASPIEALADGNTEGTDAGTSVAFGVERLAGLLREKRSDLLNG